MTKYKLVVYGIEQEKVFDDESEAECEQEYLERVQNKLCKIYPEEE